MRYIMLGVMAGIGAGYMVEAFFPFKPVWGAVAIMGCIVVGAIAQCRDCRKKAAQKTDQNGAD